MRGDGHNHAVVIHLRQAEPAVLRRHFHAKDAEVAQPLNHLLGNRAILVHFIGVEVFREKHTDVVHQLVTDDPVLATLLRERLDERVIGASHEHLSGEAATAVVGIAGRFGNFHRRPLTPGHPSCGHLQLTLLGLGGG